MKYLHIDGKPIIYSLKARREITRNYDIITDTIYYYRDLFYN